MANHYFFHLPAFFRKHAATALAVFFFLGHFLGIWFSGNASELFHSSMRMVVSSHVSIIGLLSSMVLPFLFSAFAVYAKQPLFLIPIAFVKAFFFSSIAYGLFTAWGSAGWLISGLSMAGSLLSMGVLYWYWLRHIGGRRFQMLPFVLILGILAVIGILDYHFVVPFLGNIIIF